MKIHILPFGAPAWERRREILKEIILRTSGPPHDFRGVLYLVPNERQAKMLRPLFLDALQEAKGARGCVPPTFSVLNHFIESRAYAASALPVIDGLTRRLIIEDICRESTSDRSLGPLIGEALDRLYLHEVEDSRLRRVSEGNVPLEILAKAKTAYEKWLKSQRLADPARLKAAYRPKPGDFKGITYLVLDGFYDAQPFELRVLKALIESAAQSYFVLEAPGLENEEIRGEGMPYYGTEGLIAALTNVPPKDDDIERKKELSPVQPVANNPSSGEGIVPDSVLLSGRGTAPDELLYAVSGAAFGMKTLSESRTAAERIAALQSPGGRRKVTVASTINPVEEVYFIARTIKEGYGSVIADLDRVLVFFPSPGRYLPIISEAFGDYGIPFHVSRGRPLTESPVAGSLLALLRMPLDDYSFRSVRKVLFSPLIILSKDAGAADTLDRIARREGVSGGRRRWAGLISSLGNPSENAEAKAYLARLFQVMGRFEGPGPSRQLADWADGAAGLIEDAGIRGAVTSLGTERQELASALKGVDALLRELKYASARLKRTVTLADFVRILRQSLAERLYSPADAQVGGVRILNRLEVSSEPFDVIFAGGLTEGALPEAAGDEVVIGEPVARELGLPGRAESSSRDRRLFLRLALGAKDVFLTYPETDGERPASPSPYIRGLEPLIRAGLVSRIQNFCRPVLPSAALGPDELMRSLALAEGLDPQSAADILVLMPDRPSKDLAKKALKSPAAEAARLKPPDRKKFRVTELEEYITCPYRYYQDRVLLSAPESEPEDDIAPHEAGTVIHEILGAFYQKFPQVTDLNRVEALGTLTYIAKKRFAALPETLRNRELMRRFTEKTAPKFIAAEAALSSSGLKVCLIEKPLTMTVDDKDCGEIVITGKIDRVEVDKEGNFTVVDYKTGNYPGAPGGRPLKDLFQLPLYAKMLREDPSGAAMARPSGFVYYNLRDNKMRDAVRFDRDRYAGPEPKKNQRGKSAEEILTLMDECAARAVEAAKGIMQGDFPARCKVKVICETCGYSLVCRKDPAGPEPGEGDKGEG
ncbi:MAG: PD-(D/E)XK nuclease family protein [Nitrospirota bacterium]